MSNLYTPRNSNAVITPGNNDALSLPGSDISRILPRQLSTGSTRGTQTVGYGTTKIDGSNNRITIGAADGSSIGMGSIPKSTIGEYGFFSLGTTDDLIMKIVNGTYYIYDVSTKKNIIQFGRLPDGSYGMAVAKAGYNVADAIYL